MENSKIEWLMGADGHPGHTWSPWIGCQAVSAACDHCYAQATVERYGGDFSARRRTADAYWRKPIRWNKDAKAAGVRRKVFPSMCDPFDNKVPRPWRDDMWGLIADTPDLDWLLLTKRPQNVPGMLPGACVEQMLDRDMPWGPNGWPNVWLGTTTENQTEADRRIPHLTAIPATVHFLSAEPLLGAIDLAAAGAGGGYGIQWVIAGGESGPKRRRVDLEHMRDLRDQCLASTVAFFGKQDDKVHPLPGDLMVRQFPEVERR